MTRTRVQRLQEAVKEEVSDIIRREVKDPRVGFVSVTSADVSNDLRHVKIYVSILGSEAERQETMQALEKATGFIRSSLGSRIRLRHTPEIVFKYDDSIEHGARINYLLRQVQSDSKSSQGETDDQEGKSE